jgi:hypothetical protein
MRLKAINHHSTVHALQQFRHHQEGSKPRAADVIETSAIEGKNSIALFDVSVQPLFQLRGGAGVQPALQSQSNDPVRPGFDGIHDVCCAAQSGECLVTAITARGKWGQLLEGKPNLEISAERHSELTTQFGEMIADLSQRFRAVTDLVFDLFTQFGEGGFKSVWNKERIVTETLLAFG